MRAVICTRYGPPEVLRLAEVERPTPRRNQICIRIFATAVTVSDCTFRGLKLPRRYRILARLVVGLTAPSPAHPRDGARRRRRVRRTGRQVIQRRRSGIRPQSLGVRYLCGTGLLAGRRPARVPADEPELAMHCLHKAKIQPGQRVLVYGASGAIGTAAVQLARHLGAGVTGVCSTKNLKLVESLGAEGGLDGSRDEPYSRLERSSSSR